MSNEKLEVVEFKPGDTVDVNGIAGYTLSCKLDNGHIETQGCNDLDQSTRFLGIVVESDKESTNINLTINVTVPTSNLELA